jgi:hypothetical protein
VRLAVRAQRRLYRLARLRWRRLYGWSRADVGNHRIAERNSLCVSSGLAEPPGERFYLHIRLHIAVWFR